MVTIGYPPNQVGGTETYVLGLVEALKPRGHISYIAYMEPFKDENGPETRVTTEEHLGTTVYRIWVNSSRFPMEHIVFDKKLIATLITEFKKVADLVQPDIIHVHPLQLGFESYLIETFNKEDRPVVLTYHSTNTGCTRSDLIHMGTEVCDGLMIKERCTYCTLHWKGMSKTVAIAMSKLPITWYRSAFDELKPYPSLRKLRSVMSVPAMVDERFKLWNLATTNARAVVAVCEWVKDSILNNGVSKDKVVFSRHGLRLVPDVTPVERQGITRFGYLGRISPEKGIQTLVDALKSVPQSSEFEFEVCSWTFQDPAARPEQKRLMTELRELAEADKRVRILENVSDSALSSVLASWDAIVVPSFWLESGPEVIYEALAVKTPVIGSKRGGIAELVKEGESGFFFTPTKADELRSLLVKFAENPTKLRELRKTIPPVRTTEHVADDMEALYGRLLGNSVNHQSA
ncbi:MAG TPA: glycosyltransferase [Blastocatellia bacterium]|nr:glycosyltransferase [Blastocatellia bacterium]